MLWFQKSRARGWQKYFFLSY